MKDRWVVILLIIGVGTLLVSVRYWAGYPYKKITKQVSNITTEEQANQILGYPDYIFYKNNIDYYISGYAYKERIIDYKVLVYVSPSSELLISAYDVIIYLYINDKGQVEDYFVGGS